VIGLPEAPLPQVLARVDAIWSPQAAPHHIVYGRSGVGKTTLIRQLLGQCGWDRVLVIDPKPNADAVWPAGDGEPVPVTAIGPKFGYEGERGGGPLGRWFRLTGSPDRADTGRRIAAALQIVAVEGLTVLVLDDVREICRQLKQGALVDSIMSLGRSAGVCAILSATEAAYVQGRSQAAFTWVGATTGLPAARDGAALLGHSGRDWNETTQAVQPYHWIYSDSAPGSAGPCLTEVPRL
jgi:hypothetical protein